MKNKWFSCLLSVMCAAILPVAAEEVTVEEDSAENLLQNASFETPGRTPEQAANWGAAAYRPAIRTNEKAFDGQFSMKITGDGQNYFGLRQIIPGAKVQGKSKLEVSACFYYEADLRGHFFPIYFIVSADGKQFYPQPRVRRNSDPKGQWFRAAATLDLTPYTNIRHIEVFTLGWKYGNNFFSGTVYIDNFEAYAE
ncbi:MAG: hypothetical protein E7053_06235 [Lentisphaerae bacterium]|nr:hypothetical protein [Lentisphaerota bacterium]